MRWQNFSIWQGKLPHWRADGVLYYVTFRHRRTLDESERRLLFQGLMAVQGKKLDLTALCVLPESTELMFHVRDAAHGRPHELSAVIESAKTKAGKKIIAKSGERFAPFYSESFDRIVRDEAEMQEKLHAILEAPGHLDLEEEDGDYATLWISAVPSEA